MLKCKVKISSKSNQLNSISKAISKFTLLAIKLYFIVTLSVGSAWVYCDLTFNLRTGTNSAPET